MTDRTQQYAGASPKTGAATVSSSKVFLSVIPYSAANIRRQLTRGHWKAKSVPAVA